jgi:hypothetical protein
MQDDFGTFGDKTSRHVFTDACGAAGDEDNLVFKSHDGGFGVGSFFYGKKQPRLKRATVME